VVGYNGKKKRRLFSLDWNKKDRDRKQEQVSIIFRLMHIILLDIWDIAIIYDKRH
jgi:hypothetical protein